MSKKVEKDRRYGTVKKLFDGGSLNSLQEILDIIPPSVLVKDTGISYVRLTGKFKEPSRFIVKDIIAISNLIDIDSRKFYDLIALALEKKPASKK